MYECPQLNMSFLEANVVRAKTTPSQHHFDSLKRAMQFSGLSDRELAYFYDAAEMISVNAGSLLFSENAIADYFYVICSGWIKIFRALPDNKEAIIDILTAGNLAGIVDLFKPNRYSNNAVVVEDTMLLRLPLSFLEKQIRLNSDLALDMLSFLFREQKRHRSKISLHSIRGTSQRLGGLLLRLSPQGKETDVVYHLPSDMSLLAKVLGTRERSLNRAMVTLMDAAPVRIIDTRVEIDSVKQLATFVYGKFAGKYLADTRCLSQPDGS